MHNQIAIQADDALIRPLSDADAYPATTHWIYMDAASMALLPAAARNHAIEVLDSRLLASVNAPGSWSSMTQSCRTRFAELIGANAQNIRLSHSLAGALGDLAPQLDMQQGGNLVVCAALSHPGFVSFWREFAQRRSLELREVPLDPAGFDVGRLRDLVDEQTLMVALPAVSHVRGWRLPVAGIGSLCRERGVFFLVDGTSSAGILQMDVEKTGINGLVVAAEGNALGIHGLGFLFVAETGFMEDRRRIHEVPDLINLAIADEALGVLAGCGIARIEGHALALAERLRNALEEVGLPVERPRPAGQQSHIAAVGKPGSESDGVVNDPDLRRLAEQLTAGRVRYAIRGGQLQFSFHLYNRLRDVMDVRRIAAQSLIA